MAKYFSNIEQYSNKSWYILFFTSLFFGFFGLDLFYLGNYYYGFYKLVTFGGFGIWWLKDLILIFLEKKKDFEGKRVLR